MQRPNDTAVPRRLATALLMMATHPSLADSFLHPQGPIAAEQRLHFWFVIGVMGAVIVPIFVTMPFLLWRYRYGHKKGVYRPRWHRSRFWETVIWTGPLTIVAVLGVVLWHETVRLDPYGWKVAGKDSARADLVDTAAALVPRSLALQQLTSGDSARRSPTMAPIRVEVVGFDWKWLFIYPDQGVASVNALWIAAGTPVTFSLTSDTVMQSFFIPALGSQIFAMNHMVTHLNLQADREGRFVGENTQYSGAGFAQQHFAVNAVSTADFEAWINRARHHGISWSPAAIKALQAPGTAADVARALDVSPPASSDAGVVFRGVPATAFGQLAGDAMGDSAKKSAPASP